MSLKNWMIERLNQTFQPRQLTITDESHLHEGHGGWRESGETHFRVVIASDVFEGKSRLACHRLINEAVRQAFDNGLHALAIEVKA